MALATNNRSSAQKKVQGKTKRKPVLKKKKEEKPYFLVCIGASAGGLNAVLEIVSQFPATLHAAVCIVLHLSKSGIGEILAEKIKKRTLLSCVLAQDKSLIRPGTIYIAPPNVHLLVKKERIVIGHGPSENRFRPSIDVLFRSAAASYSERTIGIVLTGFLNDGTSGMWAIRQSGGHCIVQDPNEAEYPDMPLSVLETLEVDYCVPLKEMGKVIENIIHTGEITGIAPPDNVVAESRLSEMAATGVDKVASLGEKTDFACPDCGGGLWKIQNGRVKHYRCHIGHSYSEKDLLLKQDENIQQTLWVAIRMMEERKIMLMKISNQHAGKGLHSLHSQLREQAQHLDVHIEKLKDLLYAVNKD
jgi:two-component system chemotaxis response regulator CheB